MKKLISMLCAVIMCFSITACGKKTVKIEPESLINYVLSNVHFDNQLTEIQENMTKKVYQIEEGTTAEMYIAGGASAEEITVFTSDTADNAKKMLNNVKEHIKDQKDVYASYDQGEVKKLDNAVTLNYDKYVIVVVSPDGNAEKTINNYINSQK